MAGTMDPELRPSKSARKREMQALQQIAERLMGLREGDLDAMALPDDVREEVVAGRRLTRAARRRQVRRVASLMKELDAADLAARLAGLDAPSQAQTAALHRLEDWRERVMTEGDAALPALAAAFPGVELSRVRAYRRAALREHAEGRPPKSARALFRYLRGLDDAAQ